VKTKKSNNKNKTTYFPRREEVKEKRKNHYVDKDVFLQEIIKYQQTKKINDALGKMMMDISIHFSRHPSFRRYKDCLDELHSEGILAQIKALDSFDPNKSSNPVAYFTEVVKNAFRAYLGKKYKNENFHRRLIHEEYHKLNIPFVDEIEKDLQETKEEQLKRILDI